MGQETCERLRSRATKSPMPPDTANPLPHPQNESEFRDKLSPIHIALNFSLDPQAPVDSHGLRPVLHYQSKSRIEDKVRRWGSDETREERGLGTWGQCPGAGSLQPRRRSKVRLSRLTCSPGSDLAGLWRRQYLCARPTAGSVWVSEGQQQAGGFQDAKVA